MNDVHNFNAGPAALPKQALERAQKELVNFDGTGMSVMELSHRSDTYDRIHTHAIKQTRKLLEVPDDYHILFLQGGASLQFPMVPMNFLDQQATYVLTGAWSEKALAEAKHFGKTAIGASGKDGNYKQIPALNQISEHAQDSYVHMTSNNTIYGTQWHAFPNTKAPLVCDMSSDIFSRRIPVNQFGLIYAGAQKNLGPSGVTLVLIQDSFLQRAKSGLPAMLSYDTFVKSNSLYNTPPVFSIYMLGLVLDWLEESGGLTEIENRNKAKAQLLYDAIDESDGFYMGHANQDSRSNMNVTFTLANDALTSLFLQEAKEEGFVGLNGHRSVGGLRASIYNAVPYASCEALVDFMKQFKNKHAEKGATV
ncbi:phosphoserine aminotransferase [Shouchella clausii]|uniref:3-phosphoserine/phosphohydroxythreonine transaminase n=1 Tax=Shouchella tritolerans TaxID=2979466 RepID=UPI0007882F01|nr:3-phosphoserine/phosphohydroxythreonine transaminase [Shouchella tritolerans]GIN10432.1 phosphoserine aminotransferase [Shouchella clausii]